MATLNKIFFNLISISLLWIKIIDGNELECQYLISDYNFCRVENADLSDLSSNSRNDNYTFTGSEMEKQETTFVWFYESPNVQFIPLEIFDEFPMLIGLKITRSETPVIKENLFGSKFEKIEHLDLFKNEIEKIEDKTFQHLKNLKWISFFDNKIASLSENIFETNQQLEYIDFSKNKIRVMNPGFFKQLNFLRFVELQENDCVDRKFGCSDCLISQYEFNSELSSCFLNCMAHNECMPKSNSTIEIKCEVRNASLTFPETQQSNKIVIITKIAISEKAESSLRIIGGKNDVTTVGFTGSTIKYFTLIQKNIVGEFPALNIFNISGANISTLNEDLFTIEFEKIEYLELSKSKIQSIEPQAFHHMKNLKWISLESNEISILEGGIFIGNSKLEYINLSNNKLKKINASCFEELPNLKYLKLQNNICIEKTFDCLNCTLNATDLNQELAECYVGVEKIECEYGILTDLPLWPSSVQCIVRNLNISTDFEYKSFTGSKELKDKTTIINFDMINGTLPHEIIKEFNNLNGIKISRPKKFYLSNNLFGPEFGNIELLHLRENGIQAIQNGSFRHLTKLKWINLEMNEIEKLNENIFEHNFKLEYVSFVNNKILMINLKLFGNLYKLKLLNLEGTNACVSEKIGCKFCTINKSLLDRALSRCHSNCKANQECSSKSRQEQTKEVRQISCDLNKVKWLRKKICLFVNLKLQSNMIYEFDEHKNQTQREKITAIYFKSSDAVELIPEEIRQTFPKLDAIGIQNSNGLSILKESLFRGNFINISDVLLTENGIQQIEEDAFSNLINLLTIDLSNNNIKSINARTFAQNVKLEVINLYGNKISMIQRNSFKIITNLKEINLLKNVCIATNFGCGIINCPLIERVDEHLESCFLNYFRQVQKLNYVKSSCYSSIKTSPFIKGGTILTERKYPWVGGFFSNAGFTCGSSLITNKHVLLAAHCIKNKKNIDASAPESSIFFFQNNLDEDGTEIEISEIIVHPDWDSYILRPEFKADIAIAILKNPIHVTNEVNHICLNSPLTPIENFVGQNATVTGWGQTETSGDKSVNELREVSVPIVEQHLCNNTDHLRRINADSLFCAGTTDSLSGPCKGDSGSGLVMNINNIWTLIGIVSSGLTRNGICDLKAYVLFTDVSKFYDWIYRVILETL